MFDDVGDTENTGDSSASIVQPSAKCRSSSIPTMLSRSNSLMDEDPGMMSEAETSATGFRRGSKPRPSLPVVRTPSKTLERPLGNPLFSPIILFYF